MVYPKSGTLLRPLGRGRSDGKRWPYTSFALVTFLRPWLLRMYILQTKTSLRLAVHEYNILQRGKMIGWLGVFCGHDSATDQASDMRGEFATDSCFIDVDMESKPFSSDSIYFIFLVTFLRLIDWQKPSGNFSERQKNLITSPNILGQYLSPKVCFVSFSKGMEL